MAFLTLGNHAAFAFPIKRTYAGPLDHHARVEYINDLFNNRIINSANPYEGMQVYITKGSQWVGIFPKQSGISYDITVPEGWNINHTETETEDRYIVTNNKHKGEIWVLTDIDKITNPPLVDIDWTTWLETVNPESGWKKLGESNANLQWEQLK